MQPRRLEAAKKKITGFGTRGSPCPGRRREPGGTPHRFGGDRSSRPRRRAARLGRRLRAAAPPHRRCDEADGRREADCGHRHAADAAREDRPSQRGRGEGRPQERSRPERLDLPHLLDDQADHRRGDDDAVRGREVAARRSGLAAYSGVRQAPGPHRRQCRRVADDRSRAPADDDARADDAHGGPRLRAEFEQPGRPHDHPGARARHGGAAADDDRQAREAAAAGAAGHAVVVQHRRRRPGLPRREVLWHEVRRVPQDPAVRAAGDEGHGVLRAAGEALPPRARACRGKKAV